MHTLPEFVSFIRSTQEEGKTVALVSGSFDICTAAHVALLEFARSKADSLAVLVNSDESVRLYKGSRPFVSEQNRARIIRALRSVDAVALLPDLNPIAVIESAQPRYFVNGFDWGECIEKSFVEKYGGEVFSFTGSADTADVRTSALVSKIRENAVVKVRAIISDEHIQPDLIPEGFELVMSKVASTPEDFARVLLLSHSTLAISQSWVVTRDPRLASLGRLANARSVLVGDLSFAAIPPNARATSLEEAMRYIKGV